MKSTRSPWWTIGWRNLGRNRRRTVITALALACGYFAVVVLIGLAYGIIADMIDSVTGTVNGQIQVHAAEYLPDRSVHETIGGRSGTDLARLLDAVRRTAGVEAATPRVHAGGLISSGDHTVPALIIGIDGASDTSVARIATPVAGRLPARGARELLIGEEMATELGVSVGDELVVVAPAADGSLGNDLFTVSGVFRTGIAELDASRAIGDRPVIQELVALAPDRIHEVAIRATRADAAPAVAASLDSVLAGVIANSDAAAWTELQPELVDYAALARSGQWIILVIVFGMAIFGVANTMLMASWERRHEYAVLLALGAGPAGIVRAVLSEALALGAISLAAGAAVTMPVLFWWHVAPLDLSGIFANFEMLGADFKPVLRTEYPWGMLFGAGGALLLTALLAAAWPAFRSSHLPPAEMLTGR